MDKYFFIIEYENEGGLFSTRINTEIREIDIDKSYIDEINKIKNSGDKLIKIIKGKEIKIDE